MQVSLLKEQIKNKTIRNFYIFIGEEWKVQQIYLKKLSEITKFTIDNADTIVCIQQKLHSRSFFEAGKLYVVRDDYEIISNEKLRDLILSKDFIKNNMLVLVLTQPDKRLKQIKALSDVLVEFNKLPVDTLKKHLKQVVALNDINCETLIHVCEGDYARILSEADKIRCYGGEPNEAFNTLLRDGIIYVPPEDSVFDLVDAILNRNVTAVYTFLENCKNINEHPLVILQVLYLKIKELLQVQSYKGNDVVNATGIVDWQVKKLKSKCGNYTDGELVYALRLINDAEIKLKTGLFDESILIDYVLVNVL